MSNEPNEPNKTAERSISQDDWRAIGAALREAFDPADVDYRVQGKATDGGRAQVVAYIDARAVQDRLDTVVGPGAWSFAWEPVVVAANEVQVAKGTITIYGVSKSDAGSASNFEQTLGAVSHCFKRAAVHWGIGRYLYDLSSAWVQVEKNGRIPDATLRELRAKLPRPSGPTAPTRTTTPAAASQAPAQIQPQAQQPAPAPTTTPTGQRVDPAQADLMPASAQQQRDFVASALASGLSESQMAALISGQLRINGARTLAALKEGVAEGIIVGQIRQLLKALPDTTAAASAPAAKPVSAAHGHERLATEPQRTAITNLCRRLDRNDPAPAMIATFAQAATMIAELGAEYDRKRADALAG